MSIDDAFRKRGFRRWYERQLIESHAYLVTGFLSLIMVAVTIETIEFKESLANSLVLALIACAGGYLCIFAVSRFNVIRSRAEALAEQAVCTRCNAYARFDVIEAHDATDAPFGRSLTVRCRGCANEWKMGQVPAE